MVDGNAGSRSAVANMLHDFGISEVKQVGRASDARRLLEPQRFDVVVCSDAHLVMRCGSLPPPAVAGEQLVRAGRRSSSTRQAGR